MEKDKDLNEDSAKKKQKVSDQMLNKASATYKWWNNLATLNKEDSIPLSMAKISIRVVGIIVLIAISPIALLALLIAFMAVL